MLAADVIVVGGGVAGIAAARTLARGGASVLLVERDPRLGGMARSLACMATEVCRKCGACLVEDALAQVAAQEGITVRTGARIARAERATDITIDLERAGGTKGVADGKAAREQWKARGAILCTGYDVYDAALKPFLGYGKVPGVTTTLELDEVVRADSTGKWLEGASSPARVAFVQCVGSRESREGRGYCSQVCCTAAFRLAGKLAHLHPGTGITIYYIDLQLSHRGVAGYRREIVKTGKVRFVQGVPGEIVAAPGGGIEVRHEDAGDGRGTSSVFDKVVLAVGMVPRPGTLELGRMLGLGSGDWGFAAEVSSTQGAPVIAAGACVFPSDIPGSMDRGKDAAMRMTRLIGKTGAAAGPGRVVTRG